MNRIYRTIWNATLGAWVAAPETARTGGGACHSASGSPVRPAQGLAVRLHHLAAALAAVWGLAGALPHALAACTPAFGAGANVTCTGSIFGIDSTANNMIVTVAAGALVQAAVVNPGYVVNLTGNNMTFNNNGTVDPTLLAGLSLLTSGARIGGTNNSFVTVNNTGILKGTSTLALGLPLANLTGLSLDVQNGASGQNTLTNSGTIGSTAILGVAVSEADIPVISVRGGSPTTFTNTATGTITGRIAFQGSSLGNKFINAGILNGSLHMGTGGIANTFTAVTGSQVSQGDGVGGVLSVTLYPLLTFAATGTVDGGGGTLNNLILQNSASGTGSGTTGTGTISSANYINFSKLTVNSGTWTLSGPVLTGTTSTTLNGGILSFDNALGMGSGQITSNGGTLQAGASSLAISNVVNIAAGGLSIIGGNTLALTSATTGSGVLTKSGIGTLVLSGANTHSGGTTLAGGTIQLGNGAGLGTGALNVTGASTLQNNSTMTVTNDIQLNAGLSVSNTSGSVPLTLTGVISGTGALTKTGASDLTLTGNSNFSGGFNLTAGKVILGSAASIGSGVITASGGTSLDTQAALTLNNNLVLNGALTLTGSNNLALNGQTSGTGSLVKAGSATLTLNSANNHSGGVSLGGGGLILGNSGALGTGALAVTANSSLDVTAASTLANNIVLNSSALTLGGSNALTLGGTISGAASGSLTKNGTGILTLSGASSSFAGGVNLNDGKLIVGSNNALGSGLLRTAAGTTLDSAKAVSLGNDVSLGGNLTIAGSSNLGLGGDINGTGGLTKAGNGTLTLAGNSSYTGNTTVNAGTLQVDGSLGSGTTVAVASGATLGGEGNIAGAVTIDNGGHLGLRTGKTLSLGSLVLNATSAVDAALGVPDTTALANVSGNLTLDGTLNVSDAGGFGLGVYRLFNYGGTLTDNGLTVGTLPTGVQAADLQVQTSVGNQVNLVVGGESNVRFWDGAGTANDGVVSGGAGVWNSSLANWSTANGGFNQAWNDSFAVFQGQAGTVTVQGTQRTTGMQFASDGYHLVADASATGGQLELVNNGSGYAAIRVDAGNTATLDVALSGSATLAKFDSGTLVLNGDNSYSGGTRLYGGTLEVGHNNALGTGAVQVGGASALQSNTAVALGNAIALDADLTLAGSHDMTLTGSISGGGELIKQGLSTVTLAGANSGTGRTTIQAGRLVASAASLAAGAITNNATLELNQGSDATLTQAISGTGSFTKTGVGTLTLAGANTSTGTTTISTGGLVASVANLGSGAITNNAALELNQASDATLTQTISGTGSFTKTGAGTLTLAGANTSTGTTTIDAGGLVASVANLASGAITNNAALELNQTNDASLLQAIGGSGSLTKTGAGALTLSGDSSGYTGRTNVVAGSLRLTSTGQLGGTVTVASGATLSGTGTVGSAATSGSLGTTTTVQSGAVIAAGDASTPYGALHVAGDLTLEQGAIYKVKADPTSTSSSLIQVAGKATLGGSVLHVGNESNAANDFQVGKTYTILHAGSIVGAFDAATSNYAYLDANLGYTSTDVTLKLQRNDTAFATLATSSNQVAAANAIENLPSSHALFQYVQGLTKDAAHVAFDSLSGDTHASVVGSLTSLGARAPSISSNHLRSNLTAGMHPGAPVAQSDGPLPASAWPSSKALPAWAEVVGHWQTYNGDGNAAQLKQRTYGLFLGMDQEVGASGWRLGGSLGYTNADGRVADRSSTSKVDSYSGSVYGGKSFGTGTGPRINVLGGLAYTWHDIETTRNLTSLGQTLKANYSANTAQLFAEVGYAIGQYDKLGFEPFVGVSLGQQRTGSFQETGGFAALKGQSSTDDLASTTLGLRVHSDFQIAGKDTRVRATVGWRHAFGDVATRKTMAFEGGQNFTVAGAPLARNTAVLGLEGEVALSRRAALVVGYRGEVGSGQRDHSANVKLRWSF
ncbi:MAG: autotransporter domain-containing protein [Acidovorax sp.]|jgi:outer membrane autotransporter protein|nr:autotransporter domain-containing protein [Acidovorax sp.]